MLVDRAQIRAREDIQREEDRLICEAIRAATTPPEIIPQPIFDIVGVNPLKENEFPNSKDSELTIFGVKHMSCRLPRLVEEMPEGAYARFERSDIQSAEALVSYQERISDLEEAFTFDRDRAMDDGYTVPTFFEVSAVTEPADPACIIQDFEFPLFDIIGFKPSKENEFIYPEEKSPFTIYGIKGIPSPNPERFNN
jgi:hypothetical protein